MVSVQYNIFVLTFGALQGILLSVFLIRKRSIQPAVFFLLLYLLTLLLQVAMKTASKSWLWVHFNLMYQISYMLPFLYGPFLYLFIKHLTKSENQFSRKTALHVLPFFFDSILQLSGLWLSEWIFPAFFYYFHYLSPISLVVYHVLSFRLLTQMSNFQNASNGVQAHYNWLRQFIMASFITTFTLTLALFAMFALYPRHTETRWLFAVVTIFIYWVSYKAMSNPDFFNFSQTEHADGKAQQAQKYNNSTLTKTEIERITTALDVLMFQKRAYLNPDLTIDELAIQVNTNRHNLSQVLNGHLQKNFSDYLNTYRVKAAQEMLLNLDFGHLKIAAIAYDAGFNSLSTFNAVFKKFTGLKPSDFRQSSMVK